MSDIDKIQLIHDAKNKFQLTEEMFNNLADQIEDSKYKDNIQRFFDGYKIEDSFHMLFSSIPWIKLIHSLDQNQLPSSSKEDIQVPDFNIIYETSAKELKPILIEVKSVTGQKENLN